MPEEEKKTVDIDTSGPDAEVVIEETKDESVVETENTETENKEPETDKSFENERETKLEEGGQVSQEKEKKDDEQLEDYSKGVQSRIAKLTRKMREAERREKAALEYAKAVEAKRQTVETKFTKVNEDYVKQFETRVQTGLDSAQKELATAIENADAASQIDAQKKIAALSIDEARLNALKEQQTNTTTNKEPAPTLSAADPLSDSAQKPVPAPDPRAEDWASDNSWFGKDRAMTYTAFEIHKDLTEKEGFDPQTDEYYAEVDKRIRLEFPQKFDTKESQTSKPTQNVASVKRSSNVRSGRQTVRLTSSQVAIAKKLGVPLEEYAKQIKLTEGA
tara:strand:+ start:200 stop:1201 length:1002 start_codon:yes stop_codon:yes gene_type:complete